MKFNLFRTNWYEIVLLGTFALRGVRSAAGRTNISRPCAKETPCYFITAKLEVAVVELTAVCREADPDPNIADPQWLTCDFSPLKPLPHPVTLAELKADSWLSTLALLNQPHLAVMPITDAHFQTITYADTVTGQLGISLDILIVGGQVDPKLQAEYSGKRTKFLAYRAVIATTRTQLEWLLRQLNEKP